MEIRFRGVSKLDVIYEEQLAIPESEILSVPFEQANGQTLTASNMLNAVIGGYGSCAWT